MTFDRRRDMHAVAGPLPNMRCNSKHGAWEDGGRREMLLRLTVRLCIFITVIARCLPPPTVDALLRSSKMPMLMASLDVGVRLCAFSRCHSHSHSRKSFKITLKTKQTSKRTSR